MAGLLYKDFVTIHGKIFATIILVVTVFLAAFSISPLSTAGNGEGAIILGAWVAMGAMVLPMIVPGVIEGIIIQADRGAKKKAYLMSLPVNKRQYVASKYLFVFICYYVILSVVVIWAQFANIGMEKVLSQNFLTDVIGMMPLWIQALLLVSAIELPFFINKGVKAGNAIKTSLMAVVMFGLFAYMLFGDLTVLERFHLMKIMDWLKEHVEMIMTLQVLGPMITGGLYYVSYRVAAVIFERKEQGDEE